MNLYVMRHGRTNWNEKGIIQGRRNNMLSKTGKQQAEKTALKYKDVKFDIIVCSPIKRTMQTANIVNKYHNVKIIKDEDIIEVDQGDFSGRLNSSLTEEEKIKKHERSKEYHLESYDDVFERDKKFLKTLKQKYPYENILVVTHNCNAGYIDYIMRYGFVDKYNYDDLKMFDNAEIRKYTY